MMRPRHTWLAFGFCLAVGAAAMGWLGYTVVRLDAEREANLREMATEERVRLALWRMDSAMSALLARESMRPGYMYAAFYPAEQAYTRLYAQLDPGEVLVASPLLTFTSPYIKLHFDVSPNLELTSPQVPRGNMQDLAETGYVEHEDILYSEELLSTLDARIGVVALRQFQPPTPALETSLVQETKSFGTQYQISNSIEYTARSVQTEIVQTQAPQKVLYKGNSISQTGSPWVLYPEDKPPPTVWNEGDLKPAWLQNELFLLRRVQQDNGVHVQGCWLDWDALQPWLLDNIIDLFPNAQLSPIENVSFSAELTGRRLASLPVILHPGPSALPFLDLPSTTRLLLWAALACIGFATLALVVLMGGSIALSERRAAFVSAVTHELRTPLTTFQMYTEMLTEGMVRDESQRKRYLSTLHAESNRLAHLVENVLSYARLERNHIENRLETVPAHAIVENCQRRLEQRCEQAGMLLIIDAPANSPSIFVDRDAVERILFNLVDNACKYAKQAEDKRVHVTLTTDKRDVVYRVCDHGPGIDEKERHRIFRAFTKATRDVAHATPGIGLGLGLSHRLARAMGGKLEAENRHDDGACFTLRLPTREVHKSKD